MTSDDDKVSNKSDSGGSKPARSRKAWQRMRLTYAGEAKDVVQSGSGKLSPSPDDPGDVRKPPGQDKKI